MANYLVQGKLGVGKGKFVVNQMREALRGGRRVATNVDLFLEKLLPPSSKATVCRLPDKPTSMDLTNIGPGCPDETKFDEDTYGIMVLDELGSWLNARSHASPDRAAFIDWIIHARKHRWHVYFVAQDMGMVDRQLRDGLIEYVVKLFRADKMRIPVIGKLMGKRGLLKGLHIAHTSMVDMPGYVVERDWFKGTDLQDGYYTLQCFRNWAREPSDPGFRDEVYAGPFSYLSAWHIRGRFEAPQVVGRSLLRALIDGPVRPPVQRKPKTAVIGLVERLPADEAWAYARRLAALPSLEVAQ